MDQAFVCPECGTIVEVRGIAPGRQVRCGFCHRLLEVPYMPRVENPAWHRKRLKRPWWFPWVWGSLGFLAVLILAAGLLRIIANREHAALVRSIDRLIETSEQKVATGDLRQALLDLDSALILTVQNKVECSKDLATLKEQRKALAIRETRASLTKLDHDPSGPFPLGDWLNLEASIDADPDLSGVRGDVKTAFQGRLRQAIDAGFARSQAAFDQARPQVAFDAVNELTPLLNRLAPDTQRKLQAEANALVTRIINRHGIVLDPLQGQFHPGSQAKYQSTLIPRIREALIVKGYLPRIEKTQWSGFWSESPYRLSLDLHEKYEGGYLASENRLTRIDAWIRLNRFNREIWQTTPTVRTMAPLPKLPAYYSARVALSKARVPEFEQLLYDDARGRIDERIIGALQNMPGCDRSP